MVNGRDAYNGCKPSSIEAAADAIVAVAPQHNAGPADFRKVNHRLKSFRHAQSNPAYSTPNAGAVASLEPGRYGLIAGLHQFADLGGLILCAVAEHGDAGGPRAAGSWARVRGGVASG